MTYEPTPKVLVHRRPATAARPLSTTASSIPIQTAFLSKPFTTDGLFLQKACDVLDYAP